MIIYKDCHLEPKRDIETSRTMYAVFGYHRDNIKTKLQLSPFVRSLNRAEAMLEDISEASDGGIKPGVPVTKRRN